MVAIVIAVLVNAVPFPNFAVRTTHHLLKRFEEDLTMLLLETKTYSDSAACDRTLARSAIASIEMMHTRTSTTVKNLKQKLPASKAELHWLCKAKAATDLEEWVQQSEELLMPLKMLR